MTDPPLLGRAFRRGTTDDPTVQLMLRILDFQDLAPPIRRLRDWALAAAGVRRGERVVDIGSGTGTMCRELAALVGPEGARHRRGAQPGAAGGRRGTRHWDAGVVRRRVDRRAAVPRRRPSTWSGASGCSSTSTTRRPRCTRWRGCCGPADGRWCWTPTTAPTSSPTCRHEWRRHCRPLSCPGCRTRTPRDTCLGRRWPRASRSTRTSARRRCCSRRRCSWRHPGCARPARRRWPTAPSSADEVAAAIGAQQEAARQGWAFSAVTVFAFVLGKPSELRPARARRRTPPRRSVNPRRSW